AASPQPTPSPSQPPPPKGACGLVLHQQGAIGFSVTVRVRWVNSEMGALVCGFLSRRGCGLVCGFINNEKGAFGLE
ncbi:hypothetical protein Tco_0789617, partial [Tanacetum coccineum]